MVQAVGFLPGQREHLLCARRKIAHRFITHTSTILLWIG
jgi:hypothetical protein